MTDYHPLISRAVEGLDRNTGEARRALYERARTALVTQLRAVDPPISESEITRERLALEDAIRKVEAEAARRSRTELREQRPAPPPPRREQRAEPRRAEPAPPRTARDETDAGEAPRRAPQPSARERLVAARPQPQSMSQEGIKGFRSVVSEVHDLGAATAKAAQSARDARDSYDRTPPRRVPPSSEADEFGFDADAEDLSAERYQASYDREADDEDDGGTPPPRQAQHAEEEHPRPPRSYRGLVQLAVAVIILAGIAATVSWQWPHIAGLYRSITQIGARQPSQQPSREATAQPKFPGRVPQEQTAGQPSGAGTPGSQTEPAVAQRVVLYEEDSNDPQGKRYVGSAIWRTETVSPGPGLAPELAVRADVTIPERKISMTWSLRRNTDQALPASHTIEIMFTLPADFAGGGIANVPGILMKQSEQTRGTPLAGLAVKVTNGFFLIGLSSAETDVQHNLQLLKERPWFDIPIVYTNGGRAILAMEKGPPGDRAFAEAFAAWEKK
jgi:hypothetical protein